MFQISVSVNTEQYSQQQKMVCLLSMSLMFTPHHNFSSMLKMCKIWNNFRVVITQAVCLRLFVWIGDRNAACHRLILSPNIKKFEVQRLRILLIIQLNITAKKLINSAEHLMPNKLTARHYHHLSTCTTHNVHKKKQ